MTDHTPAFADLETGTLEEGLHAVLAFINDGVVPDGAEPPDVSQATLAERARDTLRTYLVERTLEQAAVVNALAEEFPVRLRFDVRDGFPACDLDPVPGGFGAWLAWSLAVLHSALAARLVDRIKVCGNEECGWLFLDESRNRSRRWCDMAACGSRLKARAYRARRRASSSRAAG